MKWYDSQLLLERERSDLERQGTKLLAADRRRQRRKADTSASAASNKEEKTK
jgi:hypothetical protein